MLVYRSNLTLACWTKKEVDFGGVSSVIWALRLTGAATGTYDSWCFEST